MKHPAAPRDDSWFGSALHGGGEPSSSETETEPWDAQQPYLKEGFYQAGQNILNNPLSFFPGKTWIPFSPESKMAMGAQASRARAGSPLLRGAQAYTGGVMSGNFLGSRPGQAGAYTSDVLGGEYLDGSGAEGADASKMYDSILSAVEPAVASRWGRAGRMGGSPLAAESFGRGVTRGIAPYEFQAAESAADRASREYMQERGLMEGAAGREYGLHGMERGFMEDAARRAPGLAREDYFDIGKLAEVGAMREGKKRERLADRMARWDFAQNEPGNRIEQYMRLISGNYGGTTTGQTTSPGANPFLLGTGAALGLAGLPTEGGGSLGASAIGK